MAVLILPSLSNQPTPQNGDNYLPRHQPISSARLVIRNVSANGTFSALHNLPLVLFCRPNSWRNQLEQISAERGVSLNVALEADSLSLQTHIVSEGGVYALLGPYAIAAASKERRLRSSKLVAPVVTRHIALAMSRHGELTLACRTVMQIAREIAKSGVARLRRV
jgi:DNA-binding transcriptional LysR family regulator